MHEFSIVEQLVRHASAKAVENGATRVIRVSVVVGELTGYVKESLEEYYAHLIPGTILEGSSLETRYVKPVMRCPACNEDFTREKFSFDCPKCGKPGVMTAKGSEFYIENIEIEVD